jgi:hypothetical protein
MCGPSPINSWPGCQIRRASGYRIGSDCASSSAEEEQLESVNKDSTTC